nr:MAG TPA: hypothetical protein [Bacteriophage sp.]
MGNQQPSSEKEKVQRLSAWGAVRMQVFGIRSGVPQFYWVKI